jgi:hypothetical protein
MNPNPPRPSSRIEAQPMGEGKQIAQRLGQHRLTGLPLPIKIRADIRASLAASLTGEPRLDVGQPHVIRPPVAADRGPMAALVILTVDKQATNAAGAHFGEGDLLGAGQGIFDESIQSINRSSSPIALRRRSAMFSFI